MIEWVQTNFDHCHFETRGGWRGRLIKRLTFGKLSLGCPGEWVLPPGEPVVRLKRGGESSPWACSHGHRLPNLRREGRSEIGWKAQTVEKNVYSAHPLEMGVAPRQQNRRKYKLEDSEGLAAAPSSLSALSDSFPLSGATLFLIYKLEQENR